MLSETKAAGVSQKQARPLELAPDRHPEPQLNTTMLWCMNAPSPYNADLFRELTKHFNLHVSYVNRLLTTTPWASALTLGYRCRFYRRVCGVDFETLNRAIMNRHSIFLLNVWQDPTTILIVLCRIACRAPFWVWNDTPFRNKNRHPLKAYLRAVFLRWLLSRADRVLGTGPSATEELQYMGARAARTVNFPYFINPSSYSVARNINVHRFLSSGRLESIKGYDIALRALARIKERRKLQFIYEIAGAGSQLIPLSQLADSLGLSENVRWLGFLQPQELNCFYSEGGIFLHPARFEPYGVVILEAMASGLPVVASKATAAAIDRIRDRKNGYLFETESVEDLILVIERMLDSTNLDDVSKAARLTAEEWPLSRAVEILQTLVAAT